MPVYALKVDDGWVWLVKESLRNGEGRFGWSYVETADLHALRHRIARGDILRPLKQAASNVEGYRLQLPRQAR